jgi:enamine deaminase RidA (YjgF/YER057c/UK114 family)
MSPTPSFTNPEALGTPLGAYSHVARAGDLVMVAGQVGNRRDGSVPDDYFEQVRLAFTNISNALAAEGLGLENVLKFTTYLTSVDGIPEFYAAREKLFPTLFPTGKFPANTLLVISRLVHPELLIEIEAVAHA